MATSIDYHIYNTVVLKAITPKQVKVYIKKRENQGAAGNTILKEIGALSALFTWAVEEEIVPYNFVRVVKKPSKKVIRPNYTPSKTELVSIFNHLDKRARKFFLALCNTGCRVSELRGVNLKDVNPETWQMKVVRKGGREDWIYLNEVMREIYRQEAHRLLTEPLFLNAKGKRLLSIKKALGTACRKAEVPHCSHHSLRHAYATIAYEEGHDIGTISKLLGHSSPTVTQEVYVQFGPARVRQAAEAIRIGIAK